MPSVVLINGSFGVGKTSVAAELRRRIRGSRVYDPEYIGGRLQRLPSWVKLRGHGTDDFQDLALWRRSVAVGVRAARVVAQGPVLVPMAFTNRSYFGEVLDAIRRFEPQPRVFCLRASLDTIHARLRQRGVSPGSSAGEWVLRRAAECAEAHRDPYFGEAIDTEGRSVAEVASAITQALTVAPARG